MVLYNFCLSYRRKYLICIMWWVAFLILTCFKSFFFEKLPMKLYFYIFYNFYLLIKGEWDPLSLLLYLLLIFYFIFITFLMMYFVLYKLFLFVCLLTVLCVLRKFSSWTGFELELLQWKPGILTTRPLRELPIILYHFSKSFMLLWLLMYMVYLEKCWIQNYM